MESPSRMCCDVCTPTAASFFKHTTSTTRQPRRTLARVVTEEQREGLRKALETKRDKITKRSNGMSMLGKELVIPTGCIAEIVRRSQYIQLEADMRSIPGLHKDIVGLVYGVMSFFSNS